MGLSVGLLLQGVLGRIFAQPNHVVECMTYKSFTPIAKLPRFTQPPRVQTRHNVKPLSLSSVAEMSL